MSESSNRHTLKTILGCFIHSAPLAVSNLTVATVDSTTIQVDWSFSIKSVYDIFVVECYGDCEPVNTTDLSVLREGLTPGQTYSVIVYAMSNGVAGPAESQYVLMGKEWERLCTAVGN